MTLPFALPQHSAQAHPTAAGGNLSAYYSVAELLTSYYNGRQQDLSPSVLALHQMTRNHIYKIS